MKQIHVGDWLLDQQHNKIINGDEQRPLRNKVMLLLVYLADNHHRLVSRKELIEVIWSGNDGVGEKALTNAIWQLRNALGKPPVCAECILTVPKSGYQLLLQVTDDTTNSSDSNSIIDEGNSESQQNPVVPTLTLPKSLSKVRISIIAFVLMLGAGALLYNMLRTNVPSASRWLNQQSILITQYPGTEKQSKISPDGRHFVYVRRVNAQDDLFMQPIDGPKSTETIRQLTNNPQSESSPTWSPNAKQLIFIRGNKKRLCGIYHLDLSSNNETLMTQCHNSLMTKVNWSPDGKHLSIYDKRNNEDVGGLYLYDLSSQVKTRLAVPGSNNYWIDGVHAWSTDSQYLAFTHSSRIHQTELYLFHLATKKVTQLTTSNQLINGVAFNADGQSLVYSAFEDERAQLWQIDRIGGASIALNIQGYNPSISALGQSMIYESKKDSRYIGAVDVSKAADGTVKPIIESLGSETIHSYSGATKQIIFSSTRNGHSQLWIANSDGSNAQSIALPEHLSKVDFGIMSPTSDKVAFIAKQNDNQFFQVYTFSLKSGQLRQISHDNQDHFAPSWSNDGQTLFAATPLTGRWELWAYSITEKPPKQLTENGGGFYRESQGKRFFTKADAPGLWQLNDNGSETLIISKMLQIDWGNWDVANEGIYYVSRDKSFDHIMFYSFANAKHTSIKQWPKNTISIYKNFTLDNQSKQIYVSLKRMLEVDIVLLQAP